MAQVIGPDIYHGSGKFDAIGARKVGCDFAIYKIGQGLDFVDKAAEENDAKIKSAGLFRLRYFFLERSNGAAQADKCAALTKKLGDAEIVGHAVDVEKQNKSYGPTYQDVLDFEKRWREIMPGYPLGVYSGKWYWSGILGNPSAAMFDWLWDSTYVTGSGTPAALLKKVTRGYWGGWGKTHGLPVMRQFTSKSVVGGVSPCDCSVFWGTREELVTATTKNSAAPKPAPAPAPQPAKQSVWNKENWDENENGTLRLHDYGPHVVIAQYALGVNHDGYFGNDTLDKLRDFQRHHSAGISENGTIGPLTYLELFPFTRDPGWHYEQPKK